MAPGKSPASIFIPQRNSRKPVVLGKREAYERYRPAFEAHFDDRESRASRNVADLDGLVQLFEGNFDAWAAEAERLLMAKGIWTLRWKPSDTTLDARTSSAWYAESTQVVRLPTRYVRPEILLRVPSKAQEDVPKFFTMLSKVAKPFRLMDLPPEPRVAIFEFALYNPRPITLLTRGPDRRDLSNHNSCPYSAPSLLKTSRKLREEASATYYSVNEFRMELNISPWYIVFQPVAEVLSWYQKSQVPFRHLRKLSIVVRPPYYYTLLPTAPGEWIFTVRFLIGTGIQYKATNLPSEAGPHGKVIEAYRKAMGMEGEAVVLYFCKSKMDWDMLRKEANIPEGIIEA